jgi:Flp pilus assembly pilin Flp
MMRWTSFCKRFARDERGATLTEFGFVAPPFLLILLGTLDLGYIMYIDTLAKSRLHQVARAASTGGLSEAEIRNRINEAMDDLLLSSAREPDVEVASYFDFTDIGKPEKLTLDNNGNGMLDPGDCFLDSNENEEFDTNTGAPGTGGPDDIVTYTVTVQSPHLFPFASLFGGKDTFSVTNSTAVRNQPFGTQVEDPEFCEPLE